jgi:WD40-like Beta Propeller Repeat
MTKDSGETCVCQSDVPTLCDYDAGQMPQCVDTTIDTSNCGGCGIACGATSACLNSVCAKAPSQLVAPAPGCISIRAVYSDGNIYWSDIGHGTIKSIATGGAGTPTTLATGLTIASIQTPTGPLIWPLGPDASALIVNAGTIYWIGAATATSCSAPGVCTGGVGTTIMSLAAGGTPKTLLKMSMDPPPSPVSALNDAAFPIEIPGQNPPILTMTLSPDGKTIYFAAGSRFYSIPSTGAVGAPTYVGYAEGPEHGEATALTADNTYLYYPSNLAGNIEILNFGMMCDPDAAANELCPVRIAESQGSLVYDTIAVRGDSLYWGNGSNVVVGSVTGALTGKLGGANFPNTVTANNVTGFAIGTQNGYYAEDPVPNDVGPGGQGFIERGAAPPYEADAFPPSIVIARGQATPTSIAIDGTNVYWTTQNCDINYIADSPQ